LDPKFKESLFHEVRDPDHDHLRASCRPKFKWVTLHDHAPLRDGLSSAGLDVLLPTYLPNLKSPPQPSTRWDAKCRNWGGLW